MWFLPLILPRLTMTSKEAGLTLAVWVGAQVRSSLSPSLFLSHTLHNRRYGLELPIV